MFESMFNMFESVFECGSMLRSAPYISSTDRVRAPTVTMDLVPNLVPNLGPNLGPNRP